jgi:hypothetical protein
VARKGPWLVFTSQNSRVRYSLGGYPFAAPPRKLAEGVSAAVQCKPLCFQNEAAPAHASAQVATLDVSEQGVARLLWVAHCRGPRRRLRGLLGARLPSCALMPLRSFG